MIWAAEVGGVSAAAGPCHLHTGAFAQTASLWLAQAAPSKLQEAEFAVSHLDDLLEGLGATLGPNFPLVWLFLNPVQVGLPLWPKRRLCQRGLEVLGKPLRDPLLSGIDAEIAVP